MSERNGPQGAINTYFANVFSTDDIDGTIRRNTDLGIGADLGLWEEPGRAPAHAAGLGTLRPQRRSIRNTPSFEDPMYKRAASADVAMTGNWSPAPSAPASPVRMRVQVFPPSSD